MKISEYAINNPVTTTMTTLSVIVLGLLSLNRIPLIFLPDINRPFLRIQANYQGSNPEEVERLITRPIEEVMGTVPGMKTLTRGPSSERLLGPAGIRAGKGHGYRLDGGPRETGPGQAPAPGDILDPPRVTRWSTTDWPCLNFGVIWKGDPDQFESIVENVLEKRLLAVEGVANVNIGGLRKKSIWIDLDQNLLRASHINTRLLSSRINNENENVPAGFVYTGGKKYNLRVIGQFGSVKDIAGLPLNARGLRLDQLADVRFDYPTRWRWFRRLNGHDAVSISILKTSNSGIIDVNRRVKQLMAEIKADPRYANLDYQIYWDQSEDILKSINNLKKSGLIGGLLAIGVLLFFLGNLRNTMVIAVAIPVSIVCTLFFMYVYGWSRSTPT